MNPPDLHSFPTRRSSDLARIDAGGDAIVDDHAHAAAGRERAFARREGLVEDPVARLKEPAANHQERNYRTAATFTQKDRKSTRLNSSHVEISYAVFCLKK